MKGMPANNGVAPKVFRRRKIAFWVVLGLLVLAGLVYWVVLPLLADNRERVSTRVAVCGAVNRPAVYSMERGSDLGMLIRRAGGLKPGADFFRVDAERTVLNDSVYIIPFRGNGGAAVRLPVVPEGLMNKEVALAGDSLFLGKDGRELQHVSILYVGLPAVYVLITFYPELNRIQCTHIPFSTRFLAEDYRLMDLFFTLDIRPTLRIVEASLNQKIDYFLIQDRSGFISLIDRLGGVDCNLDGTYAQGVGVKPGKGRLDGFGAWEFIRFLDRQDARGLDVRGLEVAYDARRHRQQGMLRAMRNAFGELDTEDQLKLIARIGELFQTNMDRKFVLSLYRNMLAVPEFSFGTLPGYYSAEGDRLFFYPDIPGYRSLLKREIRSYLVAPANRKQRVY